MAIQQAHLNQAASCIIWLKSVYKPSRLARALTSMLPHAMPCDACARSPRLTFLRWRDQAQTSMHSSIANSAVCGVRRPPSFAAGSYRCFCSDASSSCVPLLHAQSVRGVDLKRQEFPCLSHIALCECRHSSRSACRRYAKGSLT